MFRKKMSSFIFAFCLLSLNAFASSEVFEDNTRNPSGQQDIFYGAYEDDQPQNLYRIYDGEEDVTFCCCNVNVRWAKSHGMLEADRDYSKKSTWVLYRDFIEEILNRTLFGIAYWGFGKKVL